MVLSEAKDNQIVCIMCPGSTFHNKCILRRAGRFYFVAGYQDVVLTEDMLPQWINTVVRLVGEIK